MYDVLLKLGGFFLLQGLAVDPVSNNNIKTFLRSTAVNNFRSTSSRLKLNSMVASGYHMRNIVRSFVALGLNVAWRFCAFARVNDNFKSDITGTRFSRHDGWQ